VSAPYDVVVVGAGGAGAPYAVRRAEAGARVLVVEAGPVPRSRDDVPAALLDGESLAAVGPGSPYDWAYPATLAPGRPWNLARGRAAGGSTAVNAGYLVRARAADLDLWAGLGGAVWNPERVLGAYRRLEHDLDLPDAPGHGDRGPVPVARPPQDDPVTAALVEAAHGLGLPDVPDLNALPDPDLPASGAGPVPRDVVDGVRWGTGLAYLLPALAHGVVDVRGEARAVRVVLDVRAGREPRAVGVELALAGGGGAHVRAAEVVLAAGAIGSAHLLLLSGLGPAAELARAGVQATVDLPVGRATSDHPQVSVRWRPAERAATPPTLTTVAHLAPGGAGPAVGGEVELLPLLQPTAELLGLSGPAHGGGAGQGSADDGVLDLLVAAQAPASRGTVALASTDPSVPPAIDQRYLRDGGDRAVLRDGVRAAVRWARAAGGTVLDPAQDVDLADDAALDAWVRSRLATAFHLAGSAPFGPGADAVVDPDGAVRGVRGLRVVDLSVLPAVPRRGPAATAIMLGELLAAHP